MQTLRDSRHNGYLTVEYLLVCRPVMCIIKLIEETFSLLIRDPELVTKDITISAQCEQRILDVGWCSHSRFMQRYLLNCDVKVLTFT